MSERIAGSIRIGGVVPFQSLPGLLEAISRQGASLEWGGPAFDPVKTIDLKRAIRGRQKGILTLKDDQATYGRFDGLESFCVRMGIDFDRHSEAKYEYNAALVRFRRGMTSPHTVMSDQEEKKYVESAQKLMRSNLPANIRRAGRQLDRALGPDITDLRPLRIQSGKTKGSATQGSQTQGSRTEGSGARGPGTQGSRS